MIEKIKKLLKKEPGIKARQIARKLGFDKREVNVLMYDRTDLFVVDDDYLWSLAPEELTVTFDAKWTDCISFEKTLAKSKDDIGRNKKIIFILPDKSKFFLETIARFLALCNQLSIDKKEITIDLTNNSKSRSYFNRAGFFDHLHKKVAVLPKRPKSSTAKVLKGNSQNLVEFGAVELKKESKDLVKQLTNTFVALSSEKYDDAAFTIFSELIRNIKEHSESKYKGFAALQKYDGFAGIGPHIQTIVSDSGIGIVATLKSTMDEKNPKLKKLSNIELVKEAMSKGQVSKHGSGPDSGHGMGFKSSKEKALKFDARYSVRQSTFSLEFHFRDGKLQPIKEQTNLLEIQGTHICFDFNIDKSASTD